MGTYQIVITGIVQGVGFRPFIYNLAVKLGICGTVYNDSNGVVVDVTAGEDDLTAFISEINLNKPSLCNIDSLTVNKLTYKKYNSFKIVQTKTHQTSFTIMPPDISICKDCENELNDNSNKRYQYPFITCTNCGPRYTIINHLPYDRCNTSMSYFKMCSKCKLEYSNPKDRRYHAQPIGCFDCGPQIKVFNKYGKELKFDSKNIADIIVKFIDDGKIVAIKGVGGYHLICDAANDKVVELLRIRKNRPHKPFAIMVKDINTAKKLANINIKEQEYLESIQRPIVLLQKQNNGQKLLSDLIAPKIDKIGIFLPYTPLHKMILNRLDKPIVATSANLSDEPLCINFEEINKLNYIWDYCLDHNREIINGCDDSVIAIVKNQTLFYRRARGYAPKALKLPFVLSQNVLALGANQKSTIAIAFKDSVILSPHIGDLNTIKSIEYFKQNIENLQRIYNFKPDVVVCDKHPNYESTKFADILKIRNPELNIAKVQHHYSHILAVMVEKKINQKVLGVCFDGTGYGDDGNLWGGEFILCDYKNYTRINHLKYFKLLGGTKAIKEPRRIALSLLFDIYGKDALYLNTPTIKAFTKSELNSLYLTWQKSLNAPLSSSFGRIFDAVASLCDIVHIISYEGQSGSMLESYYDENIKEFYSFHIKNEFIDIDSMIEKIEKESDKIVAVSKFFNTIVEIILYISNKNNLPIILSGGVFQNTVLLKLVLDKIPTAIFSNDIPPNDGAICLGQIITKYEWEHFPIS